MFENVKSLSAGKFLSNGEWIHPNRVQDSYELIFVTKGNVYINENGINYHLVPNDVLLLQPHLRHYGYKHSSDTEFFWCHWYGEIEGLSECKHKRLENTYGLLLYFRQLLAARIMKKGSECMDYLTRLILVELFSGADRMGDANPVAENVAAWIKANCCSNITEAQVAAQCGYNADYLNRLFKSCFSQTIKQYVNRMRMEQIKRMMLCSKLPLKDVAARAGFSDYKCFLKFFKYHEKITPTEFYKQNAYVHINSH